MSGTKRIFSAIEIPETVKKRISGHISELRAAYPDADLKWVSPDKMHLTLRFIGKASPEDVSLMAEAISNACKGARTFDLSIRGTGVFPGTRSPRVLWLGIAGAEALQDLKAVIDEELAGRGVPMDAREYRPHLTIARVRSNRGVRALVSEHVDKDFEPAGFRVSKIILFESSLKPTGPEYTVLQEAGLKG